MSSPITFGGHAHADFKSNASRNRQRDGVGGICRLTKGQRLFTGPSKKPISVEMPRAPPRAAVQIIRGPCITHPPDMLQASRRLLYFPKCLTFWGWRTHVCECCCRLSRRNREGLDNRYRRGASPTVRPFFEPASCPNCRKRGSCSMSDAAADIFLASWRAMASP